MRNYIYIKKSVVSSKRYFRLRKSPLYVVRAFLCSMSYGYPLIPLLGLLFFSLNSHAQTSTENYVLTRTYKQHDGKVKSTTDNSKYWGDASQVQTEVSYFDGLGKEKQTILVFGAPDKRDLVTKSVYDKMNRPFKNYLPVALPSRNGKIQTDSSDYYNSANVEIPTPSAWVETIHDGSPLGRVKEQKAPGVSTGVLKAYKVAGDNVIKRYWINSSDSLEQTTHYTSGELNYVETLDEDGKKIEEFTDRNGRVVAKRVASSMTTYYVYDVKAQLRYVLQPAFQDDNSNPLSTKLRLFAFQYNYDAKGRMTSKWIPGQGAATTMEYDNLDRLIYMTDAKNQQFYYVYDDMNRQEEMGIVIGAENHALVKSYYNTYTDVHSDYAYADEWGIADSSHYFLGNPAVDNKKGLLSWAKTRVLNADGTFNSNDSWLIHVYYYDRKGRLIQTFSQLYNVGVDAFEKRSYKLDFISNVVEERITQNTSGGTYRLDKSYTYDHQNRLKTVAHKFYHNGVVKKSYTHVSNSYNEVGLLSRKEYHNAVQKQTFKYTPRSWLSSTANDGGKAFQLGLKYNNNGNIDSLSWQTHSSSGSFTTINYDDANRLTNATGGTLAEYDITYDKNGNLKTLKRKKDGANIDNLSYSDYTGNLLGKVTDGENNVEGFDNGSTDTNQDYAYDNNGNLTMDLNKKISVINYNVLNLPREVTLTDPGRSVYYQYDASGNKLQTVNANGTTFYAGAFEYNSSGILQRIALEEGQLIKNGDNYDINYYLKDHLGNVRMVLKEEGTVLQETEYYPFGLAIGRSGTDTQNKHLFNGNEKQPETNWLDYGARMYDPTIGRWVVQDPLAGVSRRYSPFTYANDNPLVTIDPDGMLSVRLKGFDGEWYDVDESEMLKIYEAEDDLGGEDDKKKSIDDSPNVKAALAKKDMSLKARLAEAGYEPGSDKPMPAVDGIKDDHTLELLFIPIFKPLEWGGVKLLSSLTTKTSAPLYHYTTEAGYNAIMKSKVLNPSFGAKNARFGSGQYFTDIAPGVFTKGQTSYRLYGVPWNGSKLTHYIKIETSGLNVINNKPFNFLSPSTSPLNLKGRILGGGATGF